MPRLQDIIPASEYAALSQLAKVIMPDGMASLRGGGIGQGRDIPTEWSLSTWPDPGPRIIFYTDHRTAGAGDTLIEPGNILGISIGATGGWGLPQLISLPEAIGAFAELRSMRIDLPSLHGPIPDEIGNLSKLETLGISAMLTGTLPASMAGLSNLRELSIRLSNLEGPLPDWLASLPHLETLDLSGNAFSGVLPGGLTGWPALRALNLSQNAMAEGLTEPLSELALNHLELNGVTLQLHSQRFEFGTVTALGLNGATLSRYGYDYPLEHGDIVLMQDQIRTGNGGFVRLQGFSGNVYTLGPNSQMTMEAMPAASTSIISLVKGLIRSYVSPDTRESGGSFDVWTDTVAIGVRGTEFEVEVLGTGDSSQTVLRVISGLVDVSSPRSAPDGTTFFTQVGAGQIRVFSPAQPDGGTGNDLLNGTDADDIFYGGDGNDTLNGFEGNDLLNGDAGHDQLDGRAGNDTIHGGDGTDTLIGGDGDDFLYGGATNADLRDVIYGGDGHDYMDGGWGNDELNGGEGNDTLLGDFGSDTLIGNAGDDLISGGTGSDLMFGGPGNDTLNGGWGFDRMNGGGGADRFFHVGVADHASDWVQDYNAADGDVLVFGLAGATRAQFQVNEANTPSAGSAGVDEAFVIYRPTGQIMWALVDGAAQGQINVQIGGQVFDLLA
jgi:Ca2+-binding RTX toxin-like protein